MEWVRYWIFKLEFRSAEVSPWKSKTYEKRLNTPDGIRNWRRYALKNPEVTNYKVTSHRALEGEHPQRCPFGHLYYKGSWSMHRGRHDWLTCLCGGHFLLHCDEPGCPTEWLPDPVISPDCTASFDAPDFPVDNSR